MTQIKFSVIITTFNRAHLVGHAIQSVIDQTYTNFEVILVDDGSEDNTREVVERFDDDRIQYHYKVNEERNIARNHGISLAIGDYVNFLDSDDLLYPDHLQTAAQFILKSSHPELIHLNYHHIGLEVVPSSIYDDNIDRVNELLIDENICHCASVFVRSEIAKQFPFLHSRNAVVGEDHFFLLRLACRYHFNLINHVTNAVIEHENRSLKHIDVEKLIVGSKEIYDALRNDSEFIKYYGWKAKRYFSRIYMFLALQLAMNKRKSESLKYLLISLGIYRSSFFSVRIWAIIKQIIIN